MAWTSIAGRAAYGNNTGSHWTLYLECWGGFDGRRGKTRNSCRECDTSAQQLAKPSIHDIVVTLPSGGMMIVEKIGLEVPVRWRAQGFVRIWIIQDELSSICFSRSQAEELLRITSTDSDGVAADANLARL